MGFFPNIRALHIVMGILLVIILISPPSSIKAQEESQTWSGSAEAGTGLDFSLTGLELANGSIAATKATADNQNAPHARAQASQLAGGLLGLSGNFAESTQTAPPDNANPVSDQMAVNLPLLGSIGLTETQAHARWPQEVADAVCTTDDVVLSRASATTANAKLGSINLLLVSYDVLSYEDGISNESIVTLPESPGGMKQPRGMVAKSTSTLGRISLMNGLVTIDVDGVAELAASVTGEPGGTRIEYKPPDLVEVNASILGDPLVLSLGQSVDLSLLGLFTVTVSLGEPTNIVEQADGTYASANVPILRAQVNLLAGATTILDAVLSELSVEASVPEGGIACSADPDEPLITGLVPAEGPVTGGTEVTVTGEHFIVGETSVTIGDITIPATQVTVDGPTQLTFETPPVEEPGIVQVTVTTPGGTSDPLTFTYTATIFNGVGNGSTVRVHQPKGFTLRIVPNVSSIPAGDEYTYTAIYTNRNQSAAANVVLAFDLPDLLMGIRNDASSINDINNEADFHYDEAANQVVFKMANIEPGHGSTVSFPVKVDTASRDGDVLIIEGRLDTGSGNPAQSVTAQSDPVYVANHIYLSYFQGYPDSTFGPERPLTRAEAAAVTARFLGLRAAPRSIFPDVPEDHWAAGYITAVYDASIMKGDSLGNFNPEAPITRSEMTATVLRVMVDEENVVRYSHFGPAPSTYQDVGASHWSYDYLRLGQELHITHPMAGHLYHPDEAISRADAAVLIALSLRRGELIDGDTPVRQVFADVDRNHWAFGWIAQVTLPDHRGVNIDQHTMLLIEYLND